MTLTPEENTTATAPTVDPKDALDWQPVHRATPFIRSWIVLVAIGFGAVNMFGQDALPEDGSVGVSLDEIRVELIVFGIVLLVSLLGAIIFGYLSWRKMRYAYDYESVYINSGIVFRQERKVRLDRIQSIDIVRPLVARIFGLAELTITSAAGGESNAQIGFLKEEQANSLRIALLARASGAVARRHETSYASAPQAGPHGLANVEGNEHGEGLVTDPHLSAQTHEAGIDGTLFNAPGSQLDGAHPAVNSVMHGQPLQDVQERIIYEVPPARIILGGLLSFTTIMAIVSVLVIAGLFIFGNSGLAVAFLPALFGFGPAAWNKIVGEYGFTGAIAADGIRVRHGLLETRSKTIPPGRVQAVRLRQSLLWRKAKWWRVDVNVAGQTMETNGSSISMESVLLPVGTSREALDALWLVLPDLGSENPLELLEAAMVKQGPGHGFSTSPRSARWLDPLSYKRNGFAVTDRALVFRTGWFSREVTVVPHERTQSIGAKQGPLQRALDVATFSVHSTMGSIAPSVPHQGLDDVRQLLADQADRARSARAHAGPEQWLAQITQIQDAKDDSAGAVTSAPVTAAPVTELQPRDFDVEPATEGTTHYVKDEDSLQ